MDETGEFQHPCRRPRRGPLYWDWRCLNCAADIAAHPSRWRRIFRREGQPPLPVVASTPDPPGVPQAGVPTMHLLEGRPSWRITMLSAAGIPVQWAVPNRDARRRIRAWQAVQAAESGSEGGSDAAT
jgi:hypothetical protein